MTSCLCSSFKLQTGHCLGWKDFDRFRCSTRWLKQLAAITSKVWAVTWIPKTGKLWMWHIAMGHSWNSAILAGKPWEKTAVPLGPLVFLPSHDSTIIGNTRTYTSTHIHPNNNNTIALCCRVAGHTSPRPMVPPLCNTGAFLLHNFWTVNNCQATLIAPAALTWWKRSGDMENMLRLLRHTGSEGVQHKNNGIPRPNMMNIFGLMIEDVHVTFMLVFVLRNWI